MRRARQPFILRAMKNLSLDRSDQPR